MSRKVRFAFVFLLLGLLSIAAHSGFAQNNPLNFGNKFLATGDYVVAGALGKNVTGSNGYAIGTLNIAGPNPGITGVKQVPTGQQIVDAPLYWQTVEKDGQPGSGQSAFFRPVYAGGPQAPGYSITGGNLSSGTVACGCTGTSTGKNTYLRDVGSLLPQDASGNILANGAYEVRLPSADNLLGSNVGALPTLKGRQS